MSELQQRLIAVQTELKAPKGQYNSFGKYKYRSTEDILEALKPLLKKHELMLVINDEVKEVAGVPFIEATVSLQHLDQRIYARAQAGVDINKKGMDVSQTFGAASSYARKYALNGLFLIDDTKDADATNDHQSKTITKKVPATNAQLQAMVKAIHEGKGADVAKAIGKYSNITMEKLQQMAELTK